MIAKAVFTIIDDVDGEKTTTIIEYGPFSTGEQHPVQALIEFLDTKSEKVKIVTESK